jgi:hypothetical protein
MTMSGHEHDTAPLSLDAALSAAGVDPMSFFPLPDPAASGFTLDQLWPRAEPMVSAPTGDLDSQAPTAQKPDWMRAMTPRANG